MKTWFKRILLFALAGLVLFVGATYLRMKLAAREANRATQALASAPPVDLGETQTLEILPLYEHVSSAGGLQTGPGVSYLVRTDTASILFDAGNNMGAASPSPLEQNIAALGISLDEIDLVVISHRHPDHVGGGQWWTQKTFSVSGDTQPSFGARPLYLPEPMTYPGSEPIQLKAPARLAEGVGTTGILTFAQPFPLWLALPAGGEQSLAVNVAGQGIVLIAGCGHMGLETLLDRAEMSFEEPVVGVVGGLHYGKAGAKELRPKINLLQTLHPALISLSPHDSGPAALEAFAQAFPDAYQPIQVGRAIQFP